jgi:hypothetical protein
LSKEHIRFGGPKTRLDTYKGFNCAIPNFEIVLFSLVQPSKSPEYTNDAINKTTFFSSDALGIFRTQAMTSSQFNCRRFPLHPSFLSKSVFHGNHNPVPTPDQDAGVDREAQPVLSRPINGHLHSSGFFSPPFRLSFLWGIKTVLQIHNGKVCLDVMDLSIIGDSSLR